VPALKVDALNSGDKEKLVIAEVLLHRFTEFSTIPLPFWSELLEHKIDLNVEPV
jgi:hypothetical protein